MATFNYSALDSTSKEIKGTIEANSAKQARQKLRTKALIPLDVKEIRSSLKGLFKPYRKLNSEDLLLFTQQLATLTQAGLSIDEALNILIQQTQKQGIKRLLIGLRSHILEGHAFSSSLEAYPHSFPATYRQTIAASEQTGNLDQVLSHLAKYLEERQVIKQKITHALIYPLVMISVAISIVVFLLSYVVPQLTSLFEETQQTLPIYTRLLMNFSHHLSQYGFCYVAAFFLLMAGIYYLSKKYKPFRIKCHAILLKLPWFGKLITDINTSRYLQTLAMLQSANLPILDAMRSASYLVRSLPIQLPLTEAEAKVREGIPLHNALAKTQQFSPMVIHLVNSGEKTGALANMLERAAAYQTRHIEKKIALMLSLLEPALILFMGSIVLYIVLALLLPIFELSDFAL